MLFLLNVHVYLMLLSWQDVQGKSTFAFVQVKTEKKLLNLFLSPPSSWITALASPKNI